MFYTRLLSLLTTFLLLQSSTIFAQRKQILVSNSSELSSAILAAKPNDFIVLKNGIWQNTEINFNAKANAANPIILKSETAGKVILSGSSKITITQPHLVVNGLLFQDGSIAKGAVININADSCKVLNTAIIDYNPIDHKTAYFWVCFKGSYNLLENCLFKGKNNDHPLVCNDENNAKYNIVRSCYFKDIPLISGNNGREIIKIVGYGHSDQKGDDGAYCTIENNLFENADGEGVEIISLKSNHNFIRNNTIRTSCGGLVNRRGSNNIFENNIILAEHKLKTLGIRVANKNNTVINNYISNVAGSGIVLMSGEFTDSLLTKDFNATPRMKSGKMVREPRYGAVKYCTFSNNTIINSDSYGIDIGYSYKKNWSKDQIILLPEENIIKSNLIISSKVEGIHTAQQDKQYPLNEFVFKPNSIDNNFLLSDNKTLSNNNGFLSLDKNPQNVGADCKKLHLLKSSDVGPDWMK